MFQVSSVSAPLLRDYLMGLLHMWYWYNLWVNNVSLTIFRSIGQRSRLLGSFEFLPMSVNFWLFDGFASNVIPIRAMNILCIAYYFQASRVKVTWVFRILAVSTSTPIFRICFNCSWVTLGWQEILELIPGKYCYYSQCLLVVRLLADFSTKTTAFKEIEEAGYW